MSVPGNINPAPPPSSFDDDPEFYEESRMKKLRRRIIEEPLIPLGAALTCWALFEASRSIKAGDHHRTNRMFRRRIYAQGFTILAMVAGSAYWESDRKRRREYDGLVGEKKKKEKYEAWIKELEAREEEEQELRAVRNKIRQGEMAERERLTQGAKKGVEEKVKEDAGQPKGGVGVVKSVLEESERRRSIFASAMDAWRRSLPALTPASYAFGIQSVGEESGAASSMAPVTRSNTTRMRRVTFLDLPGELRNQIYGYLLPDWVELGRGRRFDGSKPSTNFMAVCRQIHSEAADILYGPKSFALQVTALGQVDFLDNEIESAAVANANFAALNQIRDLRLTIYANECAQICNVQDALFTVFAALRPNHKLRTLKVTINVLMRGDGRFTAFASKFADGMYAVDNMLEFRDLKPGDISRGHITAFLMDPIRTIRGLRNGEEQGKFALNFTGKRVRPWSDIEGQVSDLVQGDGPVADYKLFVRYFEVLGSVNAFAKAMGIIFNPWNSHDLHALEPARVKGDTRTFRRHHEAFVVLMRNKLRKRVKEGELTAYDEVEGLHLLHELETKLPAEDADTSFLGYNISNDGLRRWQETQRAQQKAAKEKRKRQKQAKGEAKGRKKARVV